MLNAAEVALALAAGFLSLVMGLLAWSMKSLIDNAKEEMRRIGTSLGAHEERITEHGKKTAVLEVRTDTHENQILEMRREMNGIAHRRG